MQMGSQGVVLSNLLFTAIPILNLDHIAQSNCPRMEAGQPFWATYSNMQLSSLQKIFSLFQNSKTYEIFYIPAAHILENLQLISGLCSAIFHELLLVTLIHFNNADQVYVQIRQHSKIKCPAFYQISCRDSSVILVIVN